MFVAFVAPDAASYVVSVELQHSLAIVLGLECRHRYSTFTWIILGYGLALSIRPSIVSSTTRFVALVWQSIAFLQRVIAPLAATPLSQCISLDMMLLLEQFLYRTLEDMVASVVISCDECLCLLQQRSG